MHHLMVQDILKKKFGSHTVLLNKSPPRHPEQAEREYIRVITQYMKILKDELKKELPAIKELIEEEAQGRRNDDLSSLMSRLSKIFIGINAKLSKKMARYKLEQKLNMVGYVSSKIALENWKRIIEQTLGVQLEDDYYTGELFQQLIRQWVAENTALIKSVPDEAMKKIQNEIINGYQTGRHVSKIAKAVNLAYLTEKNRARFIARDQVAKLNSQISRVQQEDAGVTEYIWSTSGDSRVREGHRALDGKRFKWSSPPIVDAKTGRRCHPGEDYQCRCVALAVFDYNTIDLPIRGNGGG
jgi:SPP1 gp7 family putative phage head morphogenesis protein